MVSDGTGRARRERHYSRANHGLARVVVFGCAGSVTLESLRWLADLGIAFVHFDRDGRPLTHSADVALNEPRLRRAQAFAGATATGIEVARYLLSTKLDGQSQLFERLNADGAGRAAFASAHERLGLATSLDDLVFAERDAALAYWTWWRGIPVQFRRVESQQLPEHWLSFGRRVSPLTGGPRLAVNPANALLNYLYSLVEAETRISCLAAGLDPGMGIVHADYRGRDSFALDLMEPIRPHVDRYVLHLLGRRTFRGSDFYETRKGNCRLLAPLTHELGKTGPGWAAIIAPVVERVVKMFADAPEARLDRIPTPLTGANRSASRTRRRKQADPQALRPTRVPTCHRCEGPLPRPDRIYCDDCLPHYRREQYETAFHSSGLAAIDRKKLEGNDPTHGSEAGRRRADANVQRKTESRQWDERFGKLTDLSAFQREILPSIRDVPLSRLVAATGLSLRYVSLIRRGDKVPHPRHWAAFVKVSSTSTCVSDRALQETIPQR